MRLLLVAAWLLCGLSPLSAAADFNTVWSSPDVGTQRLLRMTGIVQKTDYDAFTVEEKAILTKAFNDDGTLSEFGRRMLEDLVSGKLGDPNRSLQKEAKKALSLVRERSKLMQKSLGAVSGRSGAWKLSSYWFDLAAGNASTPLVLPGIFDWQSAPVRGLPSMPSGPKQEQSDRVRILVSPVKAVTDSRYEIDLEKDYDVISSRAFGQTGIDSGLIKSHDGKLIHTLSVFNLVVIEVPKQKAKTLALALETQGHFSKPVMEYRMSSMPPKPPVYQSAAVGASAFSAGLTAGWSLFGKSGAPVASLRRALTTMDAKGFSPSLVDSVPMLKTNKFLQAGYDGRRSVALIVDSGLDATHQDFSGKKVIAKDFTDDKDNKDYVGHGTHVTSTVLGSGASSQGKYKGVAAGAETILVAKIFGKDPTTTEDTILAGLDWGVKAADGRKVVINMSLGGSGNPDDVLARASNMLAHKGHGVVIAAGNSGPKEATVSSPGVARDVMTVVATDKQGYITDYSSRGDPKGYKTPAEEGVVYSKPDIAAPGGDVDLSGWESLRRKFGLGDPADITALGQGKDKCVYGPGIIAAKSANMAGGSCDVVIDGKPLYTKMAGTSMATPHVMGANMLILDYLQSKGAVSDDWFLKAKAAQMEAASSLKNKGGKPYSNLEQGAGMLEMDRLYDLVSSRFDMGLPIGNLSAEIAYWVSQNPQDARAIKKDTAYRVTRFGIVSSESGKVINTDVKLAQLKKEIGRRDADSGWWQRFKRWFDSLMNRWFKFDLRPDGKEEVLNQRHPALMPWLRPLPN
ncbi:MAG: S8 family serine peptidase [Elusimicrobiota bacterium]